MGELLEKVTKYVGENIGSFHASRIKKVASLKLKDVLRKKNPYLFRAKCFTTADLVVKNIVDAYISSSEETMFGDWLEGLALFVAKEVRCGFKSSAKGIDLEFDLNGVRYLVSVKSGPNWGNSSQINKMREDFKSANRTLRTSGAKMVVRNVNGCCYGRVSNSFTNSIKSYKTP